MFLEFRPNFVFKVTNECEIIEGEWVLSSDSTLLVIRIPDSPDPLNQLEDEWVVTWLSDTEMHFIEQDDKGDEEFQLKVAPLQSISCQSCENFTNILTDSTWSITSLVGGANDVTEGSFGSYMEFGLDGKVILHIDDKQFIGYWAVTDNCHTLEIQWAEDQMLPELYNRLANAWYINETTFDFISLENIDTDAKLQITKGQVIDCKEIHNSLLNTSWYIDYMAINTDDVSTSFIGTGLTFLENGQLATEVIVGPAVLGSWGLTGDCSGLLLDIQAGQLTELSREWIITDITNDKITLVYEEGSLRMELHLIKGQPKLSIECTEFIDYILEGSWAVKKYKENEQSDNRFEGYNYQFKEDGRLIAWNSEHEIIGRWYPIRDCGYIIIEIDQNSAMKDMAGKWRIENYNDNSIIMVYVKMSKTRTVELIRN